MTVAWEKVARVRRGRGLMDKFEHKSAVTGLGMSEVGRRLMRDPMDLTIDACLAAMEDAGLTRDDIDGVCTYPGMVGGAPGISGAQAWDVAIGAAERCEQRPPVPDARRRPVARDGAVGAVALLPGLAADLLLLQVLHFLVLEQIL